MDSTSIQITADQQSITTLRVTSMGEPIEEIETVFQSTEQVTWDKALAEGSYTNILGLTIPTFTNTEEDTYAGAVPIQSIMWELIREHYMNNIYVDITGPFIYDYLDVDQSAIIDTDAGGNYILDAANAERRDNLDINRYYP